VAKSRTLGIFTQVATTDSNHHQRLGGNCIGRHTTNRTSRPPRASRSKAFDRRGRRPVRSDDEQLHSGLDGRVHNGVVVLEGEWPLPEGAMVTVSYPVSPPAEQPESRRQVPLPLVPSDRPGSRRLTFGGRRLRRDVASQPGADHASGDHRRGICQRTRCRQGFEAIAGEADAPIIRIEKTRMRLPQ